MPALEHENVIEKHRSEQHLTPVRPNLYRVEKNCELLRPATKVAVVITGPTGAGKDTIRDILPTDIFTSFKTCTTRDRRPSEAEGDKDPYHRLTMEEFEHGIENGHFFEVNHYNDHYYGGRVGDVQSIQSRNLIPVFRIDPTGAKNYMELASKNLPPFTDTLLLTVFVTPPNIQTLLTRLYERDVAPYATIENRDELLAKYEKRAKIALDEERRILESHFVIANDDDCLGYIAEEITALILEYKK